MIFNNFKKIFLICFFVLTSCSTRMQFNDTLAIDEFVKDSYMIVKGKNEILNMQGEAFQDITSDNFIEKKEIIEEKDVLDIEIFHPIRSDLVKNIKEFSDKSLFKVKDGKIEILDLDKIEVINLTLKDAQEKIRKRFSQEIKDVKVFVRFKNKSKKSVDVIGAIHGRHDIDDKTHLFDILSRIGVPANTNLFSSYILRGENRIEIDFYRLLKMGDMSQNIVLKDKDKIFIGSEPFSKVLVFSEVSNQSIINIPNGFISLKEAILQAGAILLSADLSCIQIIRAGVVNPKIYVLDLKQIITLPDKALMLIPGDIVYISSSPINNWNRFITQVLPSLGFFDSSLKGFKNLQVVFDAN